MSLHSLLLAALLVLSPAQAQETSDKPSFRDVVAMLKDKNAVHKMDLIEKAIKDSEHDWRPRDVYQVLDLGATPEVARAAAARANIFWDNAYEPLSKVVSRARESAQAETIKITKNEDLVIIFEHLNEIRYGKQAAEQQVGPLKPREDWEDDKRFDTRSREHEVALAQALSPWDGRIDKTTFDVELTGALTPHDGSCTTPQVVVDLSRVSFDVFRNAMGGLRVDVPIRIESGNAASARWSMTGQYRFEAYGKPYCVSASQAQSLARQGIKLKMTLSRPADSDAWTGTLNFHNAATGARL